MQARTYFLLAVLTAMFGAVGLALGGSGGMMVALGMAGCLLHVWNHGLFKSLLFLCAGAVVHETRTRASTHCATDHQGTADCQSQLGRSKRNYCLRAAHRDGPGRDCP